MLRSSLTAHLHKDKTKAQTVKVAPGPVSLKVTCRIWRRHRLNQTFSEKRRHQFHPAFVHQRCRISRGTGSVWAILMHEASWASCPVIRAATASPKIIEVAARAGLTGTRGRLRRLRF